LGTSSGGLPDTLPIKTLSGLLVVQKLVKSSKVCVPAASLHSTAPHQQNTGCRHPLQAALLESSSEGVDEAGALLKLSTWRQKQPYSNTYQQHSSQHQQPRQHNQNHHQQQQQQQEQWVLGCSGRGWLLTSQVASAYHSLGCPTRCV
jgi:hypothetical protein